MCTSEQIQFKCNELHDSKLKPGIIHKITIKESRTQTGQTTDTTQKYRTLVFKILNTITTICGENCEFSSRAQVNL
jgi:hypothetical protein